MSVNQHLRSWLASVRLFWGLLILNLFAALATATVSYHNFGGDYYTYIGYADGLLHSRYSYWYFFPDYLPDTFRNPGYPLFLVALKAIGLENNGIRLIQMTLYGIIVWLLLRLARRCESDSSWLVRNLFLLLLLPNVQLAYFAADIVPELLVAFLVTIYATVALDWPLGIWRRTVALALLAGLIFQVRPVFVLFPVVQLALDFWRTRPRTAFSWVQAVALLVLFSATMLPYALWNYRHHGVLKPTSLEGGAGVMQIGFWAFRMPGYREHHYWGNQMGEEPVSFVDPSKVPGYIADFNHEWEVIEAQCRPLLTAHDHYYVPIMQRDYSRMFPTYSSAYTMRREQLLMQANLSHIRREPSYYLKTRLYTLVRLWVTGVQLDQWRQAIGGLAKLKLLYPALVSGITFVVALLSISWALLTGRVRYRPIWWLSLALVVYFGLVHLPFAIQARYTVPVRPWLLLATALALATWLDRRTLVRPPLAV